MNLLYNILNWIYNILDRTYNNRFITKFFKNKYAKTIFSFAPLIALIAVVYYYMMSYNFPGKEHDVFFETQATIIENEVGFSKLSIGVYMLMAYRHDFCLYTKIALSGLLFQNIMNNVDFYGWLDFSTTHQLVVIYGMIIFIFFSLITFRRAT